MTGLSGDDYAELAKSYEVDPPSRDEMLGEPILRPRPRSDREPDAVTGELYDHGPVPGDPRG